MLQEISIQNFAIIEEVVLSFDRGMTILTGETGAGKSIIIDAMTLLLGGRASSDFVRHGAEKSEIEGLFFIDNNPELSSILAEKGIEPSEELILRRDIFSNGRSICRVNGQLVTLAALREIGPFLIDIHGQRDNQELMNAKQHLRLLDAFGDKHFLAIKKRYQQIFEEFRKLRKSLILRQKNEAEFAQRIEILEFQIEEIESANIDIEADESLTIRRNKLTNVKDIANMLNTAYLALDGEDGGNSGIVEVQTAMSRLESVSEFDKDYKQLSEKTTEAYYLLEEVVAGLDNALSSLEFNPAELTQLEERIFILTTLKKKYGPELKDVIKTLDAAKLELSALTGENLNVASLELIVKKKQTELIDASESLNAARKALAKKVEIDIKQELTDLYMEKANFRVNFETGKFSIDGNQYVEFYIQTNPGEGFKPLAKTASGGELSRLMLAIKSSFARLENKTSIVFDEVDTGVSGRVAQAIAQKIYKIAASGQVLAISHLPQVVAIADTQFYIEKSSTENVTTSTVRKLNSNERVREIAKMLAGDKVTAEAIAQAKQLLAT